jgi:AraC-like DNA-binding protein
MTSELYQRFDTPGLAARDRFEYWREWYSQAVDAPMRLEVVDRLPRDFNASAEVLSLGEVDLVEYRFGAAVGSWTREAIVPTDRLRLVIVGPARDAHAFWHGHELSLDNGVAGLLGASDGGFRAPHGLRGIQVNVPRRAIAVTDAHLHGFNDQRRLYHDPTFARLVRPTLLGLAGHLHSFADSEQHELQSLWISLLNMLSRSLAGQDTNGTDTTQARWLQIRRYIRAHLADPGLSPNTIADTLHISRSTLYAALPPDTDGVASEIRRERLQRAHTILRDRSNTQPIADIAAAVGIPSAAQFSRIFHHHYGHTPRDLRAHHQTSTDTELGRVR